MRKVDQPCPLRTSRPQLVLRSAAGATLPAATGRLAPPGRARLPSATRSTAGLAPSRGAPFRDDQCSGLLGMRLISAWSWCGT